MTHLAPLDLFGPPPALHPRSHPDLVEEGRLGCRLCGLSTAQHGPTLIHRFVPSRPLGGDGTRAA